MRIEPHTNQSKGEVSLPLPLLQGPALTMLILNARANPRYAQLQPKSAFSLSLSMMQAQSLATLTFDLKETPHNPCP